MKTIDLRDYIEELVNEGRDLIEGLRDEFTINGVHKFRICLRRLRTCMDLLPESGIASEEKKYVKKLWKQLGMVRDLDVAKELSQKFDLPKVKIRKDRDDHRKKLRRMLLHKRTNKLLDHLERLRFRSETGNVNPLSHVNDLRLKLLKIPHKPEFIHDLRIVIKKVRYLREALNLPVGEFKAFQDVLGHFQDLTVYSELFPHSNKVFFEFAFAREDAVQNMQPAFTLALRALTDIDEKFGGQSHILKAS